MPKGDPTFAERLEIAIEVSGITQEEAEETAEIARGSITKMVKGERGAKAGPGTVVTSKLASALRVNRAWLAWGDGMLVGSAAGPAPLAAALLEFRWPASLTFAQRTGLVDRLAARPFKDAPKTKEEWTSLLKAEAGRARGKGVAIRTVDDE